MKYGILAVLFYLVAACDSTNNYPTKVVEVPVEIVVEKKIDCASIDGSFEQQGDTCVSVCVACLKGGGQCLDSNQNGYGDTCVTPVACTPKPETCNNVDDDCDGETDENQKFWYVDLDHDGFGDIGKPVVAGCVPPTTGPWLVLNDEDCNDADLNVSPVTAEVCNDGVDQNCNEQIDEGCKPLVDCDAIDGFWNQGECESWCGTCIPGEETCVDSNGNGYGDNCVSNPVVIDPSEVDADKDGFKALVDCNDNDASIQPGLENCLIIDQLTKYSYKLVLVWGNKVNANWPYKNTLKYKQDTKSSSYKTTDPWDSWSGVEFDKGTFVAIDLDPAVKFIRFNEFEYPGKWMICNAAKVNDTSVDFNTLNPPTIYVVKSGVWEDVTAKIGMQAAVDTMSNGPMPKSTSPSGYPQLNYCSATLTF